jgi:SH3 domain-containing YSC84-like protein 1
MSRRVLAGLMAALWLLLGAAPAGAQAAGEAQELVDAALKSFGRIVADPSLGWFRETIRDARGILIVPNLIKLGFIVGGAGGSGVLLAREAQAQAWSYPAFFRLNAASVGLQVGASVSEVALIVMTDQGMRSVLSSEFQLGVDVSLAAGPLGTGAKIATADVVAFSRGRGLYGGFSLESARITPREDLNQAYYGNPVSPAEILVRGKVSNLGADPLRTVLAEASGGS